jgi:hypothetical protein
MATGCRRASRRPSWGGCRGQAAPWRAVLPVGSFEQHRGFAGTVSISVEILTAAVADVAESPPHRSVIERLAGIMATVGTMRRQCRTAGQRGLPSDDRSCFPKVAYPPDSQRAARPGTHPTGLQGSFDAPCARGSPAAARVRGRGAPGAGGGAGVAGGCVDQGGDVPGSARAGADGAMQIPGDFLRAGWFAGTAPGQGPSVFPGHVDSRSGPAVFHRLGELRPGDPGAGRAGRRDPVAVRGRAGAAIPGPASRPRRCSGWRPWPRCG